MFFSKLHALLKKYASLAAVAAVLMGVVAAPYLIPENPDSPVFRNGTLGFILLCSTYFPLRDAFFRAKWRVLLSAGILGFLFSLALSLGSELTAYGGLLPGMGSMVRRLAVPVLAAPLFGGLIARFIMLDCACQERRSLRLPLWAYTAILLICWLPLLIAYYPGMFNYDFNTEYRQFYYLEWDGRHPLLYIVICYAIFGLGRLIDQPELAILTVTLLRMVTFAAALGYSCVFLQRRRAPRIAILLLTAAYALLPIFSVMSVSSAKDTPFTAALLVLSLLSWEAIENPKEFFASKRRIVAFVLMVLFTYHMRKNGVAAIALMLPLLIAAARGYRLKMAKLCALSVACSLALSSLMLAVFKPFDAPAFQTYSVPAQQLVRAYNHADLSQADKDEIRSWYTEDFGLTVYPHLADGAKGYLNQDRLREEPMEFMKLWARIGMQCPRIYAEAFLMLNQGSWYPDDTSHAVVYHGSANTWIGYLHLHEYDFFHEYDVHTHQNAQPLPQLRSLLERICRFNEHQKLPIISILLCTATPLWTLLFVCAFLIARKQARYIAAASGVLAIWLSYQFGPCTLARYILPLFALAPVLLISVFCLPGKASAED